MKQITCFLQVWLPRDLPHLEIVVVRLTEEIVRLNRAVSAHFLVLEMRDHPGYGVAQHRVRHDRFAEVTRRLDNLVSADASQPRANTPYELQIFPAEWRASRLLDVHKSDNRLQRLVSSCSLGAEFHQAIESAGLNAARNHLLPGVWPAPHTYRTRHASRRCPGVGPSVFLHRSVYSSETLQTAD